MMISSVTALLSVLVDSLAPFLICLRAAHWLTRSLISLASSSVASGCARSEGSWIRVEIPYFVIVVIILYWRSNCKIPNPQNFIQI